MEQRKEIVYIKNNIERKVLLNNFDELKQQTLISARYLNIENKIDLLHLKNLDIYQIEDIFCKKDGICILENCNIMDSNIIKTINFHDGNFHIINLSIIEEYTNLVLINTEDVIIKSKNISNKYSIYSGIWNDKCQKIELDTIDSFKEINLKCENLLLNGIFNLEFLQLECQNQLTIGKDNIPTIINLVRFSGIIKVNILNLNNCIIINDNDLFPLNITCKILNGENFLIKSAKKSKFSSRS